MAVDFNAAPGLRPLQEELFPSEIVEAIKAWHFRAGLCREDAAIAALGGRAKQARTASLGDYAQG